MSIISRSVTDASDRTEAYLVKNRRNTVTETNEAGSSWIAVKPPQQHGDAHDQQVGS